jgi:hypothetical protein
MRFVQRFAAKAFFRFMTALSRLYLTSQCSDESGVPLMQTAPFSD